MPTYGLLQIMTKCKHDLVRSTRKLHYALVNQPLHGPDDNHEE